MLYKNDSRTYLFGIVNKKNLYRMVRPVLAVKYLAIPPHSIHYIFHFDNYVDMIPYDQCTFRAKNPINLEEDVKNVAPAYSIVELKVL